MKHNHSKSDENKIRYAQLYGNHSKEFIEKDGINNLEYKLNMIKRYQDYIHIFVDLKSNSDLTLKNAGKVKILHMHYIFLSNSSIFR